MKMYMDFVIVEVPDETILWTNGRMVDGEGNPIETECRCDGRADQDVTDTGSTEG